MEILNINPKGMALYSKDLIPGSFGNVAEDRNKETAANTMNWDWHITPAHGGFAAISFY